MQTRWRSSFYGVSDEQQKERFLGKGGTLAGGEAIKIGKASESTKINVQKYRGSANRPPAKEGVKAVSKNKPKKVLMSNVPANWELMAFQARNSAPPKEQSTESER